MITRANVWDVYLTLLTSFRQLEDIPDQVQGLWRQAATLAREDTPEPMELIQGLSELPNGAPQDDGSYYMGGVNNGNGLGEACFDYYFQIIPPC